MAMNIFITVIAGAFFVLAQSGFVIGRKPNRLSMLVMIPFTGGEPRDGKLCRSVNELLVKIVNQRSDILPDYHLELDFQDEGPNSMQAIRRAVDYVRSYEDLSNNSGHSHNKSAADPLYPSLIAVGPNFSLGCQRYGAMVQHLSMVTIATSCLTPVNTANRKVYPNFYRQRISGEYAAYPRLRFIKEIGRWKQVAMLVNGANWVNYLIAVEAIKAHQQNGVAIKWFNAVSDIDDATMESLKASNLRVIIIEMVDAILAIKFMCRAYAFGIRGEKFVFLFQSTVISEPMRMPDIVNPGCTRNMIIEQSLISFWIGGTLAAFENNGPTKLGYDLDGFDEMLDAYTNKSRTPDYDRRHACHDCLLQAILTLDAAEKALLTVNSSLRDVQVNRERVAEAVNKSAGQVDYIGLRAGRTRYSDRLEMDYEAQVILQWSPERSFYPIFKMWPSKQSSILSVDSYLVEKVNSIQWTTLNRQPPRDSLRVVIIRVDTPISVSLAVRVLVAVLALALVTMTLIGLNHTQITKIAPVFTRPFEKRLLNLTAMPKSRLLAVLGGLVLYAAAVAFSSGLGGRMGGIVCIMERILPPLGLSLINGCWVFELINVVKNQGARAKRTVSATTITRPSSVIALSPSNSFFKQLPVHRPRKTKGNTNSRTTRTNSKDVSVSTLSFTIVNAIVLALWIVIDTPNTVSDKTSLSVSYDEQTDTLHESIDMSCNSPHHLAWLFTLIAVQIVMLITGCFLSYDLRRRSLAVFGLKQIRWGLASQASVFAASMLVVAAVNSPVSQRIVLSFICLLVASTTGCFVLGQSLH